MAVELASRSQSPVLKKERVDNGLPIKIHDLLNDSISFEQGIILGVF
jgi:hypothetical protein